jgi:hypothetical protein
VTGRLELVWLMSREAEAPCPLKEGESEEPWFAIPIWV